MTDRKVGMHEDLADVVNGLRGGFNLGMGLRFVRATVAEVVGEITVGPQHLQPYGLVHGGVYAGMVETLCSTGAALVAHADGCSAVGIENSTAFLRAVREGTLHGRATPLHTGRRSQVWEARIEDDQGRLAATGRVRLLCLEPGAEAAGESLQVKTGVLSSLPGGELDPHG
jgi:1,4-dihydroxy-2-naphthoyl-CoA hydrolase